MLALFLLAITFLLQKELNQSAEWSTQKSTPILSAFTFLETLPSSLEYPTLAKFKAIVSSYLEPLKQLEMSRLLRNITAQSSSQKTHQSKLRDVRLTASSITSIIVSPLFVSFTSTKKTKTFSPLFMLSYQAP
jgi:hypothetical protein